MAKNCRSIAFRDGNKKLGEDIFSWSIARKVSCPGASKVCLAICYGDRGRIVKLDNQVFHSRNFRTCRLPSFAQDVIEALRNKRPVAFRINDVGDFYSISYIRKWIEIVRARRDIRFFAYTRSWVCTRLWPALRELAAEPNMVLFLSCDHSMADQRVPQGAADLPWAWLAVDDDDLPDRPVDLVFRNLRRTLCPLKDPNHFGVGAMVCRSEDGQTETTCRKCGFCWRWKAGH